MASPFGRSERMGRRTWALGGERVVRSGAVQVGRGLVLEDVVVKEEIEMGVAIACSMRRKDRGGRRDLR
jgi:hypothetical protein